MKKIKVNYTIRPATERALREHAKRVDLSMSHIVDIAIELYLHEYESLAFMKGRK